MVDHLARDLVRLRVAASVAAPARAGAGTPAAFAIRLSRRERRLLGRLSEPLRVAPGAVLAREGRTVSQVVLVLSGSLAARAGDVVEPQGPGSVGGLDELIDGVPYRATLTATTPAEVLVLGRREAMSLVGTLPRVAELLTGRRLAPAPRGGWQVRRGASRGTVANEG